MNTYHKEIIEYYNQTENSYRDAWDLDNSFSLHYGYWDKTVKSFSESLLNMNAYVASKAHITKEMHVLDAGCGVGGSSIWLAKNRGCRVTGITLSQRQADYGNSLVKKSGLSHLVTIKTGDYCNTDFENECFDVVWAMESACYAENKIDLAKEIFRILKPSGTLVMADAMVDALENNKHTILKNHLKGMVVNFLETPDNWKIYCKEVGFTNCETEDITPYTMHSAVRLLFFSVPAYLWLLWRRYIVQKPFTVIQENNIKASWFQYWGLKKGLWKYRILVANKTQK